MGSPLLSLLAQVEPDLQQVSDSGISEVTTTEWILAGGVFLAAIALAMIGRRVVERLAGRTGPPAIGRLGGRLAAFLIIVLGFFYALSSVDVAVGPLLGGLGIVGIALAFSLQEILGNFAAGVLLQTRRPIRIGDQIVTNELEGKVADVNFRSVELHTFDGETIFVPNSMVLQNPITNWTKTPTRRTTLAIGLAYDSDLAEAQRVLVEAIDACAGVHSKPVPQAFVYEFGESSINLALRFCMARRSSTCGARVTLPPRPPNWRSTSTASRCPSRSGRCGSDPTTPSCGSPAPRPRPIPAQKSPEPPLARPALSRRGARASARPPR